MLRMHDILRLAEIATDLDLRGEPEMASRVDSLLRQASEESLLDLAHANLTGKLDLSDPREREELLLKVNERLHEIHQALDSLGKHDVASEVVPGESHQLQFPVDSGERRPLLEELRALRGLKEDLERQVSSEINTEDPQDLHVELNELEF